MNDSDEERGSSGINILWPDRTNEHFLQALGNANSGSSPNNISPIIEYSLKNSATILWMGDLENEFMENISTEISFTKANILFAPHHGRKSGRVPQARLDEIKPDIIVVGEAPSEDLEYYSGYNTITQNTAGDIMLECETNKIHIYVANDKYSVGFLSNEFKFNFSYYLGTLSV